MRHLVILLKHILLLLLVLVVDHVARRLVHWLAVGRAYRERNLRVRAISRGLPLRSRIQHVAMVLVVVCLDCEITA